MSTSIIEQPSPLPVAPAISVTAANPQQIVSQAGLGFIVSACLNVAIKLRIPDLLGDSTKDIGLLAAEVNVDEDYLFRVLRVLEMNQLVARRTPRQFKLTQRADCFDESRKDHWPLLSNGLRTRFT